MKKKTASEKSFQNLEDLVSDKTLWLNINRPCLLPEMYVFTLKTWNHLHCWFYLYKVFIRHLNVECLESAVPAIFLSYAPTFKLIIWHSDIRESNATWRVNSACRLQNQFVFIYVYIWKGFFYKIFVYTKTQPINYLRYIILTLLRKIVTNPFFITYLTPRW